MKLLTQIKSGAFQIEDFLEKKYPGYTFQIDRNLRHPGGGIMISIWKEARNGRSYGIKIALTQTIVDTGPIEIIEDYITNSVRKIEEYCRKEMWGEDNPSSRWFG